MASFVVKMALFASARGKLSTTFPGHCMWRATVVFTSAGPPLKVISRDYFCLSNTRAQAIINVQTMMVVDVIAPFVSEVASISQIAPQDFGSMAALFATQGEFAYAGQYDVPISGAAILTAKDACVAAEDQESAACYDAIDFSPQVMRVAIRADQTS
jgi:hypothetical protein